jgi:hypothetical protein
MPAREESILVWALVKRAAGMANPTSPTTIRERTLSRRMARRFRRVNGSRKTKLKKIRNAATCMWLYDSRPFFIRMKEDPHIMESKRSTVH